MLKNESEIENDQEKAKQRHDERWVEETAAYESYPVVLTASHIGIETKESRLMLWM